MKLTVLVDNATLTDRYFLAEPGLSIYLEDGATRILFDAGYSGIVVSNARRMGIDLLRVGEIVHSNSHLDHTWGLASLVRLFTEAKIEGTYRKNPSLVAHPDLLLPRWVEGLGETGSFLFPAELSRPFELTLSREPLWLPERLVFLG